MHRGDAGKIGDLVPAGRARRDQHRSCRHGPGRRQQLAFGDRARHVVVIARVAERTGHAAAAGVEIDDGRRRNPRQQRLGGRRQAHRSLVAVRMEQHVAGPGFSVSVARPSAHSLSRNSSKSTEWLRHHPRAALQLAAQQIRRVFADRRQAARFDEHDRLAALGGVVERMDVGRGEPARFRQAALRDQRPAAAHIRRDVRRNARGIHHVDRRETDLGIGVIGERVGKQQRARGSRFPDPGSRLDSLPQRLPRPLRQRPPPIDADQFLRDPSRRSGVRNRFDIGAKRLPQTAAACALPNTCAVSDIP